MAAKGTGLQSLRGNASIRRKGVNPEGGGGFNPHIKPIKSMRSLAPEVRFPLLTPLIRYHQFMLRVKRLEAGARLPEVAHPGEDLGYDLFALESAELAPRATVKVRTGIRVEARHPQTGVPLGLLVRDRSSIATRGIATTAGVIDAGYRGEILVLMTNLTDAAVELKAGEKIAQMIPVPVLTGSVEEVETLDVTARAEKGFGSSGG